MPNISTYSHCITWTYFAIFVHQCQLVTYISNSVGSNWYFLANKSQLTPPTYWSRFRFVLKALLLLSMSNVGRCNKTCNRLLVMRYIVYVIIIWSICCIDGAKILVVMMPEGKSHLMSSVPLLFTYGTTIIKCKWFDDGELCACCRRLQSLAIALQIEQTIPPWDSRPLREIREWWRKVLFEEAVSINWSNRQMSRPHRL